MKLYVMRHGPAEDSSSTGRDFDRVLTPSGLTRTRRVAHELARHDETPRRLLSSPLARAREPAAAVAKALDLDVEVEICDELSPGGDVPGLVRSLLGEGARRVLIVGHEPDMSGLVEGLLPGSVRGFDKAMVVGLRLRAGVPAALRFVLEPREPVLRRA